MPSPFEPIYRLAAVLAVMALMSIAGIILGDVALRAFGGQIRSSDDFAVFALAATGFLGLAPTYRRGEHIRVGLVLDRLPPRFRKGLEIVVLALAVVVVAWAVWWVGRLVHDSWRFNELTMGLIPIQLWVPQSAMLVGLAVFWLALAEDLVRVLRGGTPSYLVAPPGVETSLADR